MFLWYYNEMRHTIFISNHIDVLSSFENVITEKSNYQYWFSYGNSIPFIDEPKMFWGAGGFIAGLIKSGIANEFSSAGKQWLPSLPENFLGREIFEGNLEYFFQKVDSEQVWLKPSEAKISDIKPGLWNIDQLFKISKIHPEYVNFSYQWTKTILPLNYEHRFYILDGKVLTGSPYLIDGIVYSSKMSWFKYADALNFAQKVVTELQDAQPVSYVLDVGFDQKKEKWVVIEANRTWSSGVYGSEQNKVCQALEISQKETSSQWLWKPDNIVLQNATFVEEVNYTESSSGLLKL